MRADAERNAEKLRTAAAEMFGERGLDAPLKEIARRAGVSPGTLYNIFGTREALLDEVVAGRAAARLDEVAGRALACQDPWQGFVTYIQDLCELQAADPAINDALTRRYPGAERLTAVCDRSHAAAAKIMERARDAGALRSDLVPEDLIFIFITGGWLAKAADVAPGAWRRCIALMLDGLRAQAARPLPAGPLTPDQIHQMLVRLSGSP